MEVDFGLLVGSEHGFKRPTVVVSADVVLALRPRTLHVVQVTTNVSRLYPTDVPLKLPL